MVCLVDFIVSCDVWIDQFYWFHVLSYLVMYFLSLRKWKLWLYDTCDVLRPVVSPSKWQDLEPIFANITEQLSEVFWGPLWTLSRKELVLLWKHIPKFRGSREWRIQEISFDDSIALEEVFGVCWLDRYWISIPNIQHTYQIIIYTAHKRKGAIKFQDLTFPCGVSTYLSCTMEGKNGRWKFLADFTTASEIGCSHTQQNIPSMEISDRVLLHHV